jgi:hypothetical protein
MPRHGAILNLGGPLADGDHIEDMSLSTLRVVALGATHPPRSTQLRRQFLPTRAQDRREHERENVFVTHVCQNESGFSAEATEAFESHLLGIFACRTPLRAKRARVGSVAGLNMLRHAFTALQQGPPGRPVLGPDRRKRANRVFRKMGLGAG